MPRYPSTRRWSSASDGTPLAAAALVGLAVHRATAAAGVLTRSERRSTAAHEGVLRGLVASERHTRLLSTGKAAMAEQLGPVTEVS